MSQGPCGGSSPAGWPARACCSASRIGSGSWSAFTADWERSADGRCSCSSASRKDSTSGFSRWLAGPVIRLRWAAPAIAALWVGVDLTFGSILFQWVTLGNAGADMSLPMRLAPFTGVHGLSFVFMMMSTALALVILRRPRWQLAWLLVAASGHPAAGVSRTGAAAAPGLSFCSRISTRPRIGPGKRSSGPSVNWPCSRCAPLCKPDRRTPDLLIWPELPAPFYYYDDPEFRQIAGGLARATRTSFLFGTVAHTSQGAPLELGACCLRPAGEPVARYDKIHLVPFGEYVPWPFGFFNKITKEVGDFAPGTSVATPLLGEHRIGTFICYESAFPALARRFVQNGAEVLFNLSNDGYFGHSASAREQHLLVVRMRAAENARWIVRATNDGITASVDPAGRVVKRLPSFVETAAELPYSYRREQTFYTRHGDWFGWSCVLAGLAAVLAARR